MQNNSSYYFGGKSRIARFGSYCVYRNKKEESDFNEGIKYSNVADSSMEYNK